MKKRCNKCYNVGKFMKFDTFEYWYCEACKDEIKDPPPLKPKMKEINLLGDYSHSYPHEDHPEFDWGDDPVGPGDGKL